MKLHRIYLTMILCACLCIIYCGGKTGEQTGESNKDVSQRLTGLLPADNAVSGWKISDEPRLYSAGSLWEFINGAADTYILYGFQTVVTADFHNGELGQETVIDIYEHKDPRNAFGIYANERNPEYEFEEIGAEGYAGETMVHFWSDIYYVKITAFDEGEKLMQELRKLAQNIVDKIGTPGAEPIETGYFPKTNQVAYSAKYIPEDVLGQSYLSEGFESVYREGSNEYKIVTSSLENSEITQKSFAEYKKFIGTRGKVNKDISSPGDEGFVGEDSFYGPMMAVRTGNTIAVILSMPSEDRGRAALEELVRNIK